jgi:regulator of sigma E protease
MQLSQVVGFVAVVFAIPVTFLILVAPHEGGHFLLAKLFKVRVIEYSIFLGTKLWSTVRGGTVYSFRTIPLGGYVRLGGMEPGDYDDPQGFHGKPAYQRLLILLAGPATNFLVAAVIMTGLYLGQVNGDPGKVVSVAVPSPAYAAGMRPGDSIRSVDGETIKKPDDIRRLESANPQQPLKFLIRHPDGRLATISIQPQYDARYQAYLIGIQTAPVVTPMQAAAAGARFPIDISALIGSGLYQLATGQIPGGFFGSQGLTGPIGIGYVTVESALAGPLAWLSIVATLSVALGLANLLPIPSLDGARMVVVVLEKVLRHPFNREREMQIQRAGLFALFMLVAVISILDVQRIITGQFGGLK